MRTKPLLLSFAFSLLTAPFLQASPINPMPVEVGSDSIRMAWGLPGSTDGFIVDASSEPFPAGAPIISSITFDDTVSSLTVSPLLANTTYHLRVGDLQPGGTFYAVEFSTLPTLTEQVNGAQLTQTSSWTLRANWLALGAGGAIGYTLQASTSSDFMPVSMTTITFDFAQTTMTLSGLQPGTTYHVRVGALNWVNMPNFFVMGSTATAASTSTAAGSGLGTAAILPATASGGEVVTATVTFTVPSVGMSVGGRLEVGLPFGWGSYLQTTNPGQNGYVQVTSTAGVSFTVTPSTSQSVVIDLTSGFLAAGTQVQVAVQNIFTNCPPPNQAQAVWVMKSAMGSGSALSSIASPPVQSFVPGPAKWLSYEPWSILTVAANNPSLALRLQINDNCGRPALTSSSITITLNGLMPNGSSSPDTGVAFSTSSNFASTATFVGIPAGSSTTAFYYRTSTIGNSLSIRGDYLSPFDGASQSIWRTVNVLSSSFTFMNPSVDSGTAVNNQTSVTISPNGDGIGDLAFIRFNPSDNAIQWHVMISSDNFQTPVLDYWGYGQPSSSLVWNGRSFQNQPVSNGAYAVRLEIPGMTADNSLSITVNTAQITGTITLGGVPVSQAFVNAQRIGGTGYSFAATDAAGGYTLHGLLSGSLYNLYVNYWSTATQTNINGQRSNVTAPAANQNIALANPAVVRVAAVLPSSSPAMTFGSINIYTTNYAQNYWGNLRLLPGTTTSDNGDPFVPSTWTVISVAPGAYQMRLQLPGFDTDNSAFTVSAGQTHDVVVNLATRASIFGKLTLPAPTPVPTWISVQGTPQGSNFATVFGGAFIDVGVSTGIYSIYAVSPGTYSFIAQAFGYAPLKSTGVVVGSSSLGDPLTGGGLDFTGFSTGGRINGTLTINGNTTGEADPMTLWVSAYSPQLGQNAFTQVQLATDAAQTQSTFTIGGLANGTYQVFPPYLPGFESVPAGSRSVTVTAGTGTLNIVLNENTGQISGSITLPGGQSDYNQVHISLQGPGGREIDLASGPPYAITGLNTGYYSLVATYLTTGMQIRRPIAVTNGQTTTLNLNLSGATYGITGSVSVQSGFTMLNASGAVVTINTLGDLLDTATTQTLTLGGVPIHTSTGVQCQGGTPSVVPAARVEAFPKNFNSYDQANRSGLSNCFGVGEYRHGTIAADGSYAIAGLTPGLWEVNVYPYFDATDSPNVAVVKQVVSVVGSTVTGVDFGLSDGNSASGTVYLPPGATDWRTFDLSVVTDRGDTVQSDSVQIGAAGSPAASESFTIPSLAPGRYAIVLRDLGTYDNILNRRVTQYVAKPVQFEITGGDQSGIDIQLVTAARVVGSLAIEGANPDGTPFLTLITPSNVNTLPDSFRIFAQANPWVPSGYAEAARGSSGPRIEIDANNQFSIDGLIAGTYDVTFKQDSFGSSVQGQGSLNIAATTKGAVVLTQGQTLDLGTITLKPGLSISGTVTDSAGTPLSNIRVRAYPSNSQHGRDGQETFTDSDGRYAFSGLSPDVRIYDFVAAPRPHPGETVQSVPYGQIRRLAVDVTGVPAPTIDFSLKDANAGLTGRVVTIDGGPLSYPVGDNEGYPAAAVFLKLQGDRVADDPLGDESATALNGTFNIAHLPAGAYDITVQCLGYRPLKLTGVALSNTVRDLGTLTLQTGPSLNVTLAKPDGSAVNTGDVRQAVAASADLGSIIFGQINKDAQTNNILSIKFAGFELAPKTYSVLLFDDRDNIIVPSEGKGLAFTTSTDALSKSLTFQPSAPLAIAHVRKSGADMLITFYFSRPIRNGPGDQDPSSFLTLTRGSGVLSNTALGSDRRQLTAQYAPAAGEQNATLEFSASSVDINPATGAEFVITKTVTLLLGQKAVAEESINPALGGEVSLSDSLDPSNVSIPANALLNTDGTAADATTSYAFTFAATDDAGSAGAGSLAGAPRVSRMMARGPSAYLSEAYAAMQSARAPAAVNPLSSFYSLLLPAGLSHTLNETATLTLTYDTAADPNLINIYFFNGSQYLIENYQRVVDTSNHTISVGVSHFSTFVVIQSNQPVIQVDGDASSTPDIEVFNFPNPFNLQSKTKTLNHGGSTSDLTTDGTIIRYAIPAAMAGHAAIEIYTLVGEKVRSLNLGAPSTDTYNYVEWNGRNDAGNAVASGVYIGMLKVGSKTKFFKMAVIK